MSIFVDLTSTRKDLPAISRVFNAESIILLKPVNDHTTELLVDDQHGGVVDRQVGLSTAEVLTRIGDAAKNMPFQDIKVGAAKVVFVPVTDVTLTGQSQNVFINTDKVSMMSREENADYTAVEMAGSTRPRLISETPREIDGMVRSVVSRRMKM